MRKSQVLLQMTVFHYVIFVNKMLVLNDICKMLLTMFYFLLTS